MNKIIPKPQAQGRILTNAPSPLPSDCSPYDATGKEWRRRWDSTKTTVQAYNVSLGCRYRKANDQSQWAYVPGDSNGVFPEQDAMVCKYSNNQYYLLYMQGGQPYGIDDNTWTITSAPQAPPTQRPYTPHTFGVTWHDYPPENWDPNLGNSLDDDTVAQSRLFLYWIEFDEKRMASAVPHRAGDPEMNVRCCLQPRPMPDGWINHVELTVWDPAAPTHKRTFRSDTDPFPGLDFVSEMWDGKLWTTMDGLPDPQNPNAFYYTQASDVFMQATIHWNPLSPSKPWENVDGNSFDEPRTIPDIDALGVSEADEVSPGAFVPVSKEQTSFLTLNLVLYPDMNDGILRLSVPNQFYTSYMTICDASGTPLQDFFHGDPQYGQTHAWLLFTEAGRNYPRTLKVKFAGRTNAADLLFRLTYTGSSGDPCSDEVKVTPVEADLDVGVAEALEMDPGRWIVLGETIPFRWNRFPGPVPGGAFTLSCAGSGFTLHANGIVIPLPYSWQEGSYQALPNEMELTAGSTGGEAVYTLTWTTSSFTASDQVRVHACDVAFRENSGQAYGFDDFTSPQYPWKSIRSLPNNTDLVNVEVKGGGNIFLVPTNSGIVTVSPDNVFEGLSGLTLCSHSSTRTDAEQIKANLGSPTGETVGRLKVASYQERLITTLMVNVTEGHGNIPPSSTVSASALAPYLNGIYRQAVTRFSVDETSMLVDYDGPPDGNGDGKLDYWTGAERSRIHAAVTALYPGYNRYIYVVNSINGAGGFGEIGYCCVMSSGANWMLDTIAHELGHTLGLHDIPVVGEDDSNLMSYSSGDHIKLRKAQWDTIQSYYP